MTESICFSISICCFPKDHFWVTSSLWWTGWVSFNVHTCNPARAKSWSNATPSGKNLNFSSEHSLNQIHLSTPLNKPTLGEVAVWWPDNWKKPSGPNFYKWKLFLSTNLKVQPQTSKSSCKGSSAETAWQYPMSCIIFDMIDSSTTIIAFYFWPIYSSQLTIAVTFEIKVFVEVSGQKKILLFYQKINAHSKTLSSDVIEKVHQNKTLKCPQYRHFRWSVCCIIGDEKETEFFQSRKKSHVHTFYPISVIWSALCIIVVTADYQIDQSIE